MPSKKPKTNIDGNDEEKKDEEEELTPEQKAQIDIDRSEIINLLVAKGADVNVRESHGQQTPLHLAAQDGLSEVYEFILKNANEILEKYLCLRTKLKILLIKCFIIIII